MKNIKRYLGIFWMLLGPAVFLGLCTAAFIYINEGGTKEIHQPVPWMIIIFITVPISIGLIKFGWYAFKGEYDHVTKAIEEEEE